MKLSFLRSPLFIMLLVVVLPTAIALGLYLSGWRPAHSGSHGEFMQPPPSLEAAGLPGAPGAGQAVHWSLLYLAAGDCDRACIAALYGLRMVHMAQGKDRMRVVRIVAAPTLELAATLARQDRELRVLSLDQRHKLLGALREGGDQARIYLIDPMGNAILRYPQDTDPTGIRKDLTHLLKHSWVG